LTSPPALFDIPGLGCGSIDDAKDPVKEFLDSVFKLASENLALDIPTTTKV
jgi:hypothetical protein